MYALKVMNLWYAISDEPSIRSPPGMAEID